MNIDINKRQIAAYALLPGVLPRMRLLFGTGFGWFAFMIALVFQSARLLPNHHPYLNQQNMGQYNILHVLRAAAANIQLKWENLDQMAIFAVVVSGILLLISQVVMIVFYTLFGTAHAAGLFETVNPESDAAFMLLDLVFGVPGFYGSCALGTPTAQTMYPCTGIPAFGDAPVLPLHAGLHSLFEFYSWSILFVAVLIFVYYVVVVTAETAQTGIPLGARFNKAWAPIRMCIAIGLLIPVAYGLNSGQYIVLAVAKLGSGLATNAWFIYNDTIVGVDADGTPVGEMGTESLVPKPNIPDTAAFMAAMQLVETCRIAYTKTTFNGTAGDIDIKPYAVKPGESAIDLSSVSVTDATAVASKYEEVLDFYNRGDVLIRFGAEEEGASEPGGIVPYCGDIVIPTTVAMPHVDADGNENKAAGGWAVQQGYFKTVLQVWNDGRNIALALRWVEVFVPKYFRPCQVTDFSNSSYSMSSVRSVLVQDDHDNGDPACSGPPPKEVQDTFFEVYTTRLEMIVDDAYDELLGMSNLFGLDEEIRVRGWVGAGMWYNKISEIIGQEMQAATSLPYLQRHPNVMREVRSIKGFEDASMVGIEIYNPQIGNKEAIENRLGNKNTKIAQVLYENYKNWMSGSLASLDLSIMGDTNVIQRVIHGIFGTQGLLEIRDEENRDVHPMSLLVGIGKDLVDSTLRNVLAATGFSIAGGLYGAFGESNHAGFLNAISSAFSTIAMVGLTVGFLLYYVLPFMPFLYFFFAAGTWIKSIFEAMVGVPLWALAHLRIDGEGLPGDAASNGYFLILEIFIRPILVLFALIVSFTIFGAMVRILHEIFGLVVDNLLGHEDDNLNVEFGTYTMTLENKRAVIDEFFFTIIYTMIVYITALSCFKLIDLIPNSILRWGGGGAKTFGDTSEDPAEGLTQYAAMGGYVMGQRVMSGVNQAGAGAGQAFGMSALENAQGYEANRAPGNTSANPYAPPDLFSMASDTPNRNIAVPPKRDGS